MSYVDDLLEAYRKFVSLPWQESLAPPQRVWMAVYPPEYERRVRLHLTGFEEATRKSGHGWGLVDITTSFERWLTEHEYRDSYFDSPELLETALPSFFDHLIADVRARLEAEADPSAVVGLVGAGALFGLGDTVKVSALLNAINDVIVGRLLVFFPGEHEGNS
ncbi:MAG: DUF1788 domain-containing protein, partial [Gammaproteobacteria bacterium]